ncbi:hypothetical protein K438DRAFT_1939662 [Mycena galopus ATCC 62051]|nr:hypothetical protein K438DRAFT_1781178 [Mycena galopus ATCC 62051]KAF8175467.1 hypothetical protein K438DRAFT_1939662 [Mycena galopus ATCC 62051]
MSVLIDDNNPLVQYGPPSGWTLAGTAPEFDNTTHTSATPGDKAALEFEGTSIHVYGTIAPNAGQSRLNFSIDGVDLASYQAPSVPTTEPGGITNQLFWASPTLNETLHQLVITVDHDTSTPPPNSFNGTFFLDYFVYTPTAAAGQSILLFDDNDARVTYSPDGWQNGSSVDCLEGTQHVSTSAESWAALSFNGTGISLVGIPSQTNFKAASVVIDESQPIISQSQDQNQQLFNTSGLISGPHTINITVLEGNLGIDYFMVTNASSAASVPVSVSFSGTETSKTLPIAAIVGSAVGGLVALVLILTFTLIWRRRARARHNQNPPAISVVPRWVENEADDLPVTAPRPFRLLSDPSPPSYTSKYRPVV